MALEAETIVFAIFILATLAILNGSASDYSSNALVWAPAMLLQLPIMFLQFLAGSLSGGIALVVVPVAFILLVWYVTNVGGAYNELIFAAAVFGVVVLALHG